MKRDQKPPSPGLLRKMHELGSPIDLSVAEEERAVEITQLSPVSDTNILDLDYGRSGCFLHVGIVNKTPRPIYCVDLELRLRRPDLISTGCPTLP